MALNFGRSQRHRAADVRHLQPRAVEIRRRRLFRQHTNRALGHYLRHELVCVEEGTGHGCEQSAFAGAT